MEICIYRQYLLLRCCTWYMVLHQVMPLALDSVQPDTYWGYGQGFAHPPHTIGIAGMIGIAWMTCYANGGGWHCVGECHVLHWGEFGSFGKDATASAQMFSESWGKDCHMWPCRGRLWSSALQCSWSLFTTLDLVCNCQDFPCSWWVLYQGIPHYHG